MNELDVDACLAYWNMIYETLGINWGYPEFSGDEEESE